MTRSILATTLRAVFAALAATAVYLASTLATPAIGSAGTEAQPLSAADRSDIARIEDHLTGFKTLQCRFIQVSSNGAHASGTLSIERPGKMRMEYDPPTPVLIFADGTHLIYYDKDLAQVSYIDLDSTPAGLLVQERVSLLSEELTITKLERSPGALRISLVMTADPRQGSMTLVFADRPLALKKWTIEDAQGLITHVSLLGPQYNLPLDPELFEFKRPKEPFPR